MQTSEFSAGRLSCVTGASSDILDRPIGPKIIQMKRGIYNKQWLSNEPHKLVRSEDKPGDLNISSSASLNKKDHPSFSRAAVPPRSRQPGSSSRPAAAPRLPNLFERRNYGITYANSHIARACLRRRRVSHGSLRRMEARRVNYKAQPHRPVRVKYIYYCEYRLRPIFGVFVLLITRAVAKSSV